MGQTEGPGERILGRLPDSAAGSPASEGDSLRGDDGTPSGERREEKTRRHDMHR